MELFSRSEQCNTWEKDMYWKHFHSMHFYLILPCDFHDHLVLPSKFTEHMSSKIPNKVSLMGPSGATWDVDVSRTSTLALTGDGWKHFTKAYNLEENFLMLFQYEQNSTFKVLIFDQKKFCVMESSYFVKKYFPTDGKRKRGVGEEASTEMMEDNDDDSSEDVLSKRTKAGSSKQGHKKNPEDPRVSPSSEDNCDDPEYVQSDKAIDDIVVEVINSVSNEVAAKNGGGSNNATKFKVRSTTGQTDTNAAGNFSQPNEKEQIPTKTGKKVSEKVILSAGDNGKVLSDTSSAEVMNKDVPSGRRNPSRQSREKRGRTTTKRALPISARSFMFKSGVKRPWKEDMSHRRPVMAAEIANAVRRANEAFTEGSFIVIMRPTGVYKNFYLNIPSDWMHKYQLRVQNIPSDWMHKNLPRRYQEVTLRVGEKKWVTKFHFDKKRVASGGLATGWKDFAIENNLEESDVCLFKPANLKDDDSTFILDVEIFRVVEEVIPLTPLV